jgi:outer membrane protein OmpA-like peptidoglycan-associated protein
MRSILLALVLFAVLLPSYALAAKIENHPAVKPYEGSIASRRDDDGFRSYNLVIGVDAKGQTDEEMLKTLKVEGNVARLAYENPKQRSPAEIFANYRQGLEEGGFEILFACETKECGPSYAASRWNRMTGLRYVSPDMRYLAARAKADGGQTIYVAVLIARLRHQVEVVEQTVMETGLVTAKGLADGLLQDGRVVLDGIFFDTDKAVVKPESEEALAVIAAFLKENPDLNVYIVGHTDSAGTFDHNLSLAKRRAEAVVTELTSSHGVAPDRLAAHGVGPLSPQKSNAGEKGRADNRRVEMVQR